MEVRGIVWHGTRPAPDRYDEMVTLVRDVMGLKVGLDEPFSLVLDSENGDAFEIFKPNDEAHEVYAHPAIGFLVDDVAAARSEMEAAGIEFIGEVYAGDFPETWGDAWSHFRAPDGFVYCLVSRPTQHPGGSARKFREARICITVDDLDAAKRIFRDGLGMPIVDDWEHPTGERGTLFAVHPAAIELFDRPQGRLVDEAEVGKESGQGDFALRFEVDDIEESKGLLQDAGVRQVADEPRRAPWGHLTLRMELSDGTRLTLMEMHEEEKVEREAARRLLPN
jgi:catechol 2,3-dioxygenase-like lactoylglutathione lyase family enzyme